MHLAHPAPSLLLVDDDLSFADALARALTHRGFQVQVVNTGGEALQAIDRQLPQYGVIDLRLPDMSGLKIVERLTARGGRTNVVVLTGYGSIATAIEAVKLGATYYLTKPIKADQVVAAFDQREGSADVEVPVKPLSVDRLAWEHIQQVLARVGGNVSAAARELNMHRRTLQRKLGKYAPKT